MMQRSEERGEWTISGIGVREGSVVDFGESGPSLLVKVDVSGLGGHDLIVGGAAGGEFFAGHP